MATVAKTLRQVPQQAHPDLQINCLMDAAQYFYVAGKSFDAMEPATDAVTLASIADNKALLRRALSLLGVMYADTGNISRAIECYSQALELAQALRDNPA
ncbi:MAG TPA: tetratricopeptide repeat protein, partial [Anaeromyxobacteraceae bacterium]|nr:tetratricopeptide repeat protein [Anaeromyxobacteraceae bacterium]